MHTTRRTFLTTSSMALAVAAAGKVRLSAGHGTQAQPPAAFTDLRDGVGIFTGQAGAIGWFVSPDGVVVVDSQFPDTAAVFLEGLNQRSKNRPIDVLFITHHHGDHTAGNITLRPVVKKIVAHVKCVEAHKKATKPGAEATQAYPDATFTDVWTEKFGRETIEARHLGPAHTGGDAVIHFHRANIVHMGDLVFNRRHPYIDKAAGASIAGWIALLERALKGHDDDTVFIFGHAKPGWKVTGGKAELQYQRDYLTALLDLVRREAKSGKPREVIVKTTAPLEGFPEHGPLIERVLAGACDELKV